MHVTVTPFGSTGPRARWRGGELVASAMGGALRVTGEPDRAPVKEALDACTFHADMAAAAGAMAAHHARGTHGAGQHVDVSVQEVAFSRNVNGVLVWQFDRRKLQRVGGALNYGSATVRCIWRLADGWCFHSLMTGRFGAPANQALSDWMDERGVANPLRGVDWLSYNRSTLPAETRARMGSARSRPSSATRTQAPRSRARAGGAGSTPASSTSRPTCWPIRICAAREFWRRRPIGSHAAPVSREWRSGAGCPPARSRRAPARRPGPLAGVRVLDFAWALVGSITTKTLGDLGADVIKVEIAHAARACRGSTCRSSASQAGQFRRQAVVRASQHLEAQPGARPEATRNRARCSTR